MTLQSRIDEIQNKLNAFKHHHAMTNQLMDYEETVGPDLEFLLNELSKHRDALELAIQTIDKMSIDQELQIKATIGNHTIEQILVKGIK